MESFALSRDTLGSDEICDASSNDDDVFAAVTLRECSFGGVNDVHLLKSAKRNSL